MNLSHYIKSCHTEFPELRKYRNPWEAVDRLEDLIHLRLAQLSPDEYRIDGTIAIHRSSRIEKGVTFGESVIIGENCSVKSGAYFRNGVFLGGEVSIGANCEIKQSMVFRASRIAHLNYVGNSMIGSDVNLEAGSVLANHFNEFENHRIKVNINGEIIDTKTLKFGSLLGDGCRIGANAVLNPGTVLGKASVVGRLVHVDQLGMDK